MRNGEPASVTSYFNSIHSTTTYLPTLLHPPYGDSLLAMVVSLDLILSPSTPVQRPLPVSLQTLVTVYSYAYHRARPSRA